MARSSRAAKQTTVSRSETHHEPREVRHEERRSYDMDNNSQYSFSSMLSFLNNNAGLIFLGLAIFIIGFLAGSMWTENSLLKKQNEQLEKLQAEVKQVQQQAPAAPGAPQAPPEPEAGPLSDADWSTVQDNPAGVIGDANAKVTMVEFTDYQCPFCARYYNDSYKALYDKYVKTGKMKIVFKDQALPFHANANIAAQAARCGGEQGKFEAMHDALFANQTEWSNLGTDAAIDKFGEYAKSSGMNGDTLESCVKSGKFKKAVDDDGALGVKVGAGATPTFFINKQPVIGAQATATFEQTIEAALQ